MTSVIWTQRYDVNTLVLSAQKRLGLVGLLKILQDVAWIHGGHLGRGFEAMMSRGWIWVLARQKVSVSRWPTWGETLDVRTWARPINGLLFLRDYEIWSGGEKMGESTASWLVLDAETRRPVKASMDKAALVTRSEGTLDLEPAKIAARDDLAPLARFEVRNSDLDVNGHVNNIHYAQWILDATPARAHRTHEIADYEVNFLAETRVGDEIAIEGELASADPVGGLGFQGRRTGDGKIAFTARLQARPRATPGQP